MKQSLASVNPGSVVKVSALNYENELFLRIQAMGLRPGINAQVLQRLGRNLLLKLGNSRLVISKDLAKMVEVE
ncbi:MAG: FeoA family protein [Aquificaceae bacterium]